MTLTERLEKINAARAKSKARIALRSGRRQSVSYEVAKLMRETLQALKLENKIDKGKAA
jgi:hypothetical protein